MSAQVFFSYCHKDEPFRDQLEIHLTMLKRQKLIATWHDRRITAGSHLDDEIDIEIERSEVILLLVSPDFLASEYCYGTELKRALERHNEGTARAIPVILRPCDWHSSPLAKLRATPTDGKPVAKYADRDEAYLEICKDIRAALPVSVEAALSITTEATVPVAAEMSRSSNLRIRRKFSDHDRDVFREEGYRYIANFFENSLHELESRHNGLTTRFEQIDSRHFICSIYIEGERKSGCRIWRASDGMLGDICFNHNESARDNSMNASVRVDDDGYELGWKPSWSMFNDMAKGILPHQGAAEYFWEMMVEHLQ